MITIFTCPKAFEGNTAVIQRNAILSWVSMGNNCEIILIGDDDGVADFAGKHNLQHVPEVDKSKAGVPLINSIFEKGEKAASFPIVAYVNADIILGNDFVKAVEICSSQKKFLMVGQRIDLDVNELVNFDNGEWYRLLTSRATAEGRKKGIAAIDYFVFRKGLFQSIPPFTIGRFSWDNWLLYKAKAAAAKLIDATAFVIAIHQNHSSIYEDTDNGKKEKEIEENKKYADDKIYDLLDCTYRVDEKGIIPFRDSEHVWRRAWRLREKRPAVWKMLVSWKVRYAMCWLFPLL